jgi:arylsulfatase A-like enzyme
MIHALLLAVAPVQAAAQAPSVRPNLLVVIADDLGVDRVGCYGHTRPDGSSLAPRTPHIDGLAADGVLFRNAWAHPGCSPSRAAAVTGRYPCRTGVGRFIPTNRERGEGLRTDLFCLPDLLPVGYRSAALGKWHLASTLRHSTLTGGVDHAVRCGFELHEGSEGNLGPSPRAYWDWVLTRAHADPELPDERVPLRNAYATTRTTDDALRAIHAFGEEPWLIWVAYNAPHSPLHRPPGILQESGGDDLSTPLGKGRAMIEALDRDIGRLLAGIPEATAARTTVIFFGDNGTQKNLVEPPFDPARSKATVYQGGVNVPLLVAGAGVAAEARGRECAALVDLTDLLPTVAELLGVEAPDGLDGTSFAPYLAAPDAPSRRDWIYAERFRPNFMPADDGTPPELLLELHHQTARGPRLKLVRHRDRTPRGEMTDRLELFDVVEDFFERRDLLDADGQPPEEHAAEFRRLRALLEERAL